MAELSDFNDFDIEIDQAMANVAKLTRTRGMIKGVFPPEQDAQFKQLFDAVAQLLLATQYLADITREVAVAQSSPRRMP